MIIALLLLLVASFPGASQVEDEAQAVRQWIQAARAHRPGIVDAPLIQVAGKSTEDFRIVARRLRTALLVELPQASDRNDIVRRGAILHTDVAILLPEQAARRSDAVIYGVVVKGIGRSQFLRDLTDVGGGSVLEAQSSSNLDEAFAAVFEQFRSRYLFSYTPRGVERRGWHRLEVLVKRHGAIVKARPGYMRD